jgi:hypothetical protein
VFAIQASANAVTVRNWDDPLKFFNENETSPFVTARLVTCYPNPATSYINFKFDNTVPVLSTLSIYSFTGRKMATLIVVNNNSIIRISLDNYFRGLYVYQLCDANGAILESGRFLVKN